MNVYHQLGFSDVANVANEYSEPLANQYDLQAIAFSGSPYAAIIVDVAGYVLAANRRAAKVFFGLCQSNHDTLVGRHISDMTTENPAETTRKLRDGVATGAVTFNIARYSSIKRATDIRFRANLLPGVPNRARTALLTQDHLHDSAMMMARLNQSRLETKNALEDMTKRSLELSEALKTMEVFTNAASHDLRGPLGNLKMMLEVFRRKFSSDINKTGHEYLDIISNVSDTLQDVALGLLEHAQTSAHTIKCQPVNLKDIVATTSQTLSMDLLECGGKFEISGPDIFVQADSALLQTLVLNIVSNAVKYRSASRPLRIRATITGEGEAHPRLIISDNGNGFPQSAAERIFEPFQRLDPKVPGTGVGLATCANICRRHNWMIDAASTPDVGSRFTVTF